MARREAPRLCEGGVPPGGSGLCARATLRARGKSYAVDLLLESLEPRPRAPSAEALAPLARLGEAPVAVAWVSAASVVPAASLAALSVGDLWLPGDGWVDAAAPLEAGILAGPHSERGLPVRVSAGRTVLGARRVPVEPRVESSMSREQSDLEQLVGEAPVVVRLEVGVLEMSAARWAALRPGDVVQSGCRLEEPVVLRAAGREIARGELVDVEGEIGVRITQVGGERSAR
jgi:flagellar motor switch/type III secretory pathway protein FliN